MPNQVEISKATIHKLNEYTIHLIYKPDLNIKLADAKKISDTIHEMVKEKPYVILVDLRGLYGNMTHEARNHFANDSKINKIRIAEVLLIDNLPIRIIAKFYIKFYKPGGPIKIFGNKEKALNWLEEIYNTKYRIEHTQ